MSSISLFRLFAACLLSRLALSQEVAVVVIIRHGEKSPKSGNNLTIDGQHRAAYLSRCMAATGPSAALPLGSPVMVMASNAGPGKSTRPQDTARPLAKALSLQLDVSCAPKDHDCFMEKVQTLPANGTLLAAWEHKAIADLVPALDPPNRTGFRAWPDSCDSASWREPSTVSSGSKCYDAIWQVTLQRSSPGGVGNGGRRRRRKPIGWVANAIMSFNEGFGGSAGSPCVQGLAPKDVAATGTHMTALVV